MGPLDATLAEKILPKISRLLLEVNDVSTLPWAQMPALKKLTLTAKELRLETLEGIGTAVSIEDLDLDKHAIRDISPLAELRNLRFLCLRDNKVRDLQPLSACQRLEYLNLSGNPITDVTPLAKLEQLATLCIDYTSVRDVLSLVGLPKLEKLIVPMKLPKDNLAEFMKQRPKVKISF